MSTEPRLRHGHPITPGSAEGDRDVVEQALRASDEKSLQRQGGRRPSNVRMQGNRKKAS